MRLRASAYLPLTNCVPLGKTLKHSEPQYPHLQRGILMNNHDCSASEGDTDEQSGRPGTEKGVRNGSCEPVVMFYSLDLRNRGWEKVRACGQGSQLWRPRSDEPGVCGEPRPVKAVTPGTIQASLKDWLSARLPQRLGQQSDTETRTCTEIKGKSRSLLQTKL